MRPGDLRKRARDPRFISGIYNYCDRWCERCQLSHRCLNYATEKADDDDDPAGRDLANEKFWKKLDGIFRDTSEMIREDATALGIDLADPLVAAEAAAREGAERRRAVKNRPLARAARVYIKAVDKWLEAARPLFAATRAELETVARLEIGDAQAAAAELSQLLHVIRWYQHFVHVKLCRAIDSLASEELETDEELRAYPKDSDGSAKIALIAMGRSISAWAGLRAALGEDAGDVLDMLVHLTRLRRETEKLFPNARAFVRPGFDEPLA